MPDALTSAELRALRDLRTPAKIQHFLDCQIGYNKSQTCRSPRRVLRDRLAHCLEGALLAAAALELQGHPPLLLDLEAVRDDDHVLAIYRLHNHWGAIAKSNYCSLRFREPVYRTIRELVMSYFEHYHNTSGEKTLRAYSRPVGLSRFNGWRTAEQDVWEVADHLASIPHRRLLDGSMERRLNRLDSRLRKSEKVGMVP